MTHDVAPPGPLPHAAQAPYPAHPAPQAHHGDGGAATPPREAAEPSPAVARDTSVPTKAGAGTGRGWLIAAGAGVGLALTAALLPLLRRRPEPPKPAKRKKAPRRHK